MIDTREVLASFRTLHSLVVLDRVTSTNVLARRIIGDCIANGVSIPCSMIIAREQTAGRGRNARRWSSPAGKGIYSTVLITRPSKEIALVPLQIANGVALWLRDAFGIAAAIKWPNDILVAGRKIAGILIEARVQSEETHLAIGVGVNVEPLHGDDRPDAVSIREAAPGRLDGLDSATSSFAIAIDRFLGTATTAQHVIEQWRQLTVHRSGDRILSILGDRTISGTWIGIDVSGRALMRGDDGESIAVSAGDVIVR